MNKKTLYSLVILFVFIVGFLSGNAFSNQKTGVATPSNLSEETPKSTKNPEIKQTPLMNPANKVLIGYVQDFRSPETIDLDNLTHVVFSFVHPTQEGNLLFNGDMALTNLRATVTKAHAKDKKVMLAIGGWYHINGGDSYDYFKPAISNPSSRTKLVNELMNLVEQESLDGIDIDFEHPRTKEDAENLSLFTKDLSTALHKQDKELSIAVNAKVHSITGTEIHSVVYDTKMFEYVDYVNIMAYDGQWDGEYNAANLSPYPHTENIVTYWATLFDNHKLSKEKLVLGVPFYAQPENPDTKQISYQTIIKHNPDNAVRDTVEINGTMYHYNGIPTMERKTKLALEHGFGGMMLWEAGHDATGVYSLSASISAVLNNLHEETIPVDSSISS